MSPATDFWNWFAANERRFRDLEGPNEEALLDEILERITRVDPNLYFEIGLPDDGPLEFVVTAQGDAALFPKVRELVGVAPNIPGWNIVGPKPPQGFDTVVSPAGVELDPGECWFVPFEPEESPTELGLLLVGPGYSDETRDDFAAAMCQIIEEGLGEVSAAEDIQFVEFGPLPDDPAADGFIELMELESYITQRKTRRAAK